MLAYKILKRTRSVAAAVLALLLSLATATLTQAQAPSAPTTPSAANAGTAETSPADLSPESIDALKALVQALDDPATRDALVAQIKALVVAREPSKTSADRAEGVGAAVIAALASFKDEAAAFVAMLMAIAAEVPDWIEDTAEERSDPAVDLPPWTDLLTEAAIVLLAGLAAQIVVRLIVAIPRRRLERRERHAWSSRLAALLGRTLLDLLPVVAFAAVAYGVLAYTRPTPWISTAVLAFINAYMAFRVITSVFRALTSPGAAALRVFPLSDRASEHLFKWARRFTAIVVFGYFAIEASALSGVDGQEVATLQIVLGFVLLVASIVFIVVSRRPVARWVRVGPAGMSERDGFGAEVLRHVAATWHLFAIAYAVAVFVIWVSHPETAFVFVGRATAVSAVILCGMFALLRMARPARLGRLARVNGLDADGTLVRRRIAHWLPALSWGLRGGIVVLGAVLLLAVWSSGASAWWFGPYGLAIFGALLDIAIVAVAAVAVWELAMFAIDRYLTPRDADGQTIERSARARTLVPLLQTVILIGLSFVAGLMVLAALGVSIAPLLASAGVVGLAIGFGAQKLVQDVITGAFILFEDAVAVGDVVSISGKDGVVEKISIRTIQLRDLSGNLHSIPFSAVETVTNMTKDFSYYLLDIGVAYREDTDQVTEVIKAILDDMRDDATFGPKILEPLEVLGVDKFADSAVIIKARIKTRPIQQWSVGREFNRRMKRRFDELGIEMPFPHHTVYFGVDKQGNAPPARIEPVGADASGLLRGGGDDAAA